MPDASNSGEAQKEIQRNKLQMKKIAQSNMGTGRVATTDGSPINSCRAKLFNHICQVAPMYTPIQYMIPWPTHLTTQNRTLISSPVFAGVMPSPYKLKKLPLPTGRSGTSNKSFLGPT